MKECPICRACWDDDVDCCPDDGRTLEASLEGSRLIDGKYLLERCLGKGAMGSVYRARHKDLQKIFALKLIRRHRLQSPDSLSRFRVEARALGKLQHPNIVQVTDYGVDPRSGGVPYLIMEHLEGMTLADRVSQKKNLPLDEALPIAEAIAAAVDYAHGCGILHRDLKLRKCLPLRRPARRSGENSRFRPGPDRRRDHARGKEPSFFVSSFGRPKTGRRGRRDADICLRSPRNMPRIRDG